jgi:hypothetical protein
MVPAIPQFDAAPWVTSEDGTFRAAPASPGRVRAIVRHPQYVESQSDVVSLAPGGEAHVEVVMHQGGSLEGRVYDAHDRPASGVRVFVSATRGTLERMTRAASDGTFAFASLPDSVTLAASGGEDETPDVRLTVTIPEGGRKEVDIHLPEPRGPFPVTVVDDRGRPIEMAQVTASSLSTDSPLRATAFTDGRGEVMLGRAHGLPLRVEVQAPFRAPRIVTTDRKADALRVELDTAESIEGEVVAARGRDAIAGADVSLVTESGTRHVRTDSQGRFAMPGLAKGPARLRVRASGFAPATVALTVPDSGGRRAYAVDRIELSEEASAQGDVVDDRGEPVVGARVALDHVPTWLLVGSNPVQVAVTDTKGRFVLHELPEGSITIEAYSPDLGRARVTDVKVVSGRATDRVHIVIPSESKDAGAPGEPKASGGIAVTLGESGTPPEVVVVSVVEASGAERAGVAPGDVLLAVDDAPVASIDQARSKLSGPISDDVVLRLRREGRPLVLRVARDAVRR